MGGLLEEASERSDLEEGRPISMCDLLRPNCTREGSGFVEAVCRDESEGFLPRLNMAEDEIEAVSSEYKLGTWEERLLESNDEVEPVDMFAVS